MASIVLGQIGSSIGGSVLGPLGSTLGYAAGSIAGTYIENQLFSNKKTQNFYGPRLSDLTVQTSTYGKMIPVLYGTSRIAGNIIWSQPIREVANTQTVRNGGGKGSRKITHSYTSFSYFATLAIAICEGKIDSVQRVWADAKLLDPSHGNYRIYYGTEDQLPDPLIEAIQGKGRAPAYRGLAYIVIEDLPLAEFGNRIPNFTFEVKKALRQKEGAEDMIKSMVMIPGSGEFVYDTQVQNKIYGDQINGKWIQQGKQVRINQNNRDNSADAVVSLNQLKETCKNVEWIAPVVTWFANDLDAGKCKIMPGVEYRTGATAPSVWQVRDFTRDTAYLITQDKNKCPVYGGTTSDESIIRYLQLLKERNYKIMFYPMFFMDVPHKPWRGRVTGTPEAVTEFFTRKNGYNEFILHYASLVKDYADAFVIGSELIGLTKVKDSSNKWPAVEALIDLAAKVKKILGNKVKITYAADWSEYHHTEGGWYNLDALWASKDIDLVGIDAYFPLTDEPNIGYDEKKIMASWDQGEGYDFYYADSERKERHPLSPEYAWKNIGWWWSNHHRNPDGKLTEWKPKSKKIWFTEYGFPSVDSCTNQPNVFYDPNSSESYFPRFSKGRVDFQAQRLGIVSTEKRWQNSEIVERMFLWTWDARPFPFWPDLKKLWADGDLWRTGHWVNGKFGLSSLAAIIQDLCLKAGFTTSDIDVSRLNDLVDGYVLPHRGTVRNMIETLASAYFFDAVESEGVIKFIPRGTLNNTTINYDELISDNDNKEQLQIIRKQEIDLPQKIDLIYINKHKDYLQGTQSSQRMVVSTQEIETINLPIILGDQAAKIIADKYLYNRWTERTKFSFSLPTKYINLEPSDLITLKTQNTEHLIRIISLNLGNNKEIKISAVAEDITNYDFYYEPYTVSCNDSEVIRGAGNTIFHILDLPCLPGFSSKYTKCYIAAAGSEHKWQGASIYGLDNGNNYSYLTEINVESTIGTSLNILRSGPIGIWDENTKIIVSLLSGELESVSKEATLNGANIALIGNEIIQFASAKLVSEGKYELSCLLRGRYGTEYAIHSHKDNERFVLLNSSLAEIDVPFHLIGLNRSYKAVSFNQALEEADALNFKYKGNCLKPFAPVHIKVRNDNNNLIISWIKRTRLYGEWKDNIDVPLCEDKEEYEIDILYKDNIIRTINVSNNTEAIYNINQQQQDLGKIAEKLVFRVYQISSKVGRGAGGVAVYESYN
jgi:hypothetical protein